MHLTCNKKVIFTIISSIRYSRKIENNFILFAHAPAAKSKKNFDAVILTH